MSLKVFGDESTREIMSEEITNFVRSFSKLEKLSISIQNKNLQEFIRFLLSEKINHIEEQLEEFEQEYDIY